MKTNQTNRDELILKCYNCKKLGYKLIIDESTGTAKFIYSNGKSRTASNQETMLYLLNLQLEQLDQLDQLSQLSKI